MEMRANREALPSPKISIVVPITRMFGRLSELKSWLSEIDFRVIEVILVHDLQDEKTSEEIESVVSEYPIIKFIEKTFRSAGLARNAGLEMASGEWILFWDSDDKPHVSELEKCINLLDKDFSDIYILNYMVEKNGKTEGVKTSNWREIAFKPGIWRIIFSRDIITNNRFPFFPLGEDQLFLAQLNLPNKRICFLDNFLYTYKLGIQGQATSMRINLFMLNDSLLALDLLRKNQIGDNFAFTSIMYWRQILTLMKSGNVTLKFQAFLMALGNLFRFDHNYLKNILALKYVISRVMVQDA